MGFSSQSGQVGFKRQVTKGAFLDPGAAAPNNGVFMRTKSGSMGGNRELLIPDPEIGGNRDISDGYLGAISFSGDFEFYARMEALACLLTAALGSVNSVPTGAGGDLVGVHTITPTDALPWVSVEEAVGNGFEAFRYTDAVVNTLHLECDANGYLSGSVGLIALTQLAGITKTAVPAVDITPLLVGSKITMTYNAVSLEAKSFSLDINNNFEDDDFRLGSVFLGDLTPKRREVSAGCTIRPTSSALWRQAMYGSAVATTPQAGAGVKQQLVLFAESFETIGTTGTEHSVSITIPSATVKPFEVVPSGDDVIEADLEIQAFRPNPATPIMTAVVTNHLAAVA